MSISEHNDIITRAFRPCEVESTLNSNTLNVSILHTCEAQQDNMPCWHHADIEYLTSENITRHLCKQCYNRIWEMMLLTLRIRVQQEQKGCVA